MALSSCDILQRVQKGLLYSTPDHGSFVKVHYKDTLNVNDVNTKNEIIKTCKAVMQYAISLEQREEYQNSRPRVIVGFNPAHWKLWNPNLINLEQRPHQYLIETSTKFLETGGDLFFYIKAEDKECVAEIEEFLKQELSKIETEDPEITPSSPSAKRILQRSFDDGLANAADAESLGLHTIIGENADTGNPGASYMMTQQFQFDWLVLENMWKSEKEDMIGRRMISNCIIPNHTKRSHIFRAHFISDKTPQNMINKHRVMFRQSLPYGLSDTGIGREEGVFYLSLSNTTNAFKDVLESIVGNSDNAAAGEVTADLLINAVKPLQGTWWYVPSAEELDMETSTDRNFDLKLHWDIRSSNPYMFYNQNEYLHRMTSGGYLQEGEEPSSRVLKLIAYAFLQWNDQWFEEPKIPPIEHLQHYLTDKPNKEKIMSSSVMIRKAWAINISLGELFTTDKEEQMISSEFYGKQADLFNIHPDEIIVGRMPKFSLGLGKITMPYLQEGNEKMAAFLKGLSENAGIGHIIPNHGLILEKGIPGLINEIKNKKKQLKAAGGRAEEREFLRGCVISLQGVRSYIKNYSALAKHLAASQPEPHHHREYKFTAKQQDNFREIAQRMETIANEKPATFVEAAQLVFSVHCCLHLIGEPTSIGRLDQMLEPFRGDIADGEAQEIIDCFFVKLGERVCINKTLLVDRNTWGTCAVPYRSDGMFPNGDGINQWVQQLTVGGYKSRDEKTSASNKVTLLCLKAARRLPLNAPCLALRVHRGMDKKYLEEAAKSMLSGGAHPIILHDDRFVEGLQDVMKRYKSDVTLEDLAKVLDIACDGCYEPLFAGSTEFSFTYVPLLQVLEMAINEGATYSSAGPAYLNGMPQSMPTRPASEIKTFHELLDLFVYHLQIKTEQGLVGLLSNYGNLASVCPSPLLSSLIDGCLETNRDVTNGGAKYTMISVMYISFANTVDSLYAIKKLCFKQDTAILSLNDMLTCLKNDWGHDVHEPTHDRVAGEIRKERKTDFYQLVREETLKLPKFGTAEAANKKGIKKIVQFLAHHIINAMKKITDPAVRSSGSPLSILLESLEKKYSKAGSKFEILFTPGSGTFEGYVGWGQSCAASADGRRRGFPIASDMSAAPSPQDLPPNSGKQTEFYKAMKSWNLREINIEICNGSEIDTKIKEEFNEQDLVTFLCKYAEEKDELGGNVLTVTCANTESYAAAAENPEQYNLLRVRTGGWSEYFISFFKAHQDQHMRRVYYKIP